ncbi:hypothetical protein FSOLCH5_002822 [Fusarium solani]
MAIREHFRRALRSDATGSQLEATTPGKITATITKSSQTSDKSSSSKSSFAEKLSRGWTWGSNNREIKAHKPKNKGKKKIVHPSEKPMTAQNLQHQEMLSHFQWTFGASRPEQVEDEDFIGISPCCTRAPSVVDFSLDRDSDSDGRSSSSSSSSVKSA